MNKNIKRKIITAAAAALIVFSAVSGAVMPAHAAIGTSVNEEVINQARAVASLIQTRVQLYWSMWVDKQILYTQDPLSNPEPTWATDAEVLAAVGGYEPDGVSFAVDSMPLDRKGSFYLVATLDSSMGGAAAASYVRNFLPMAVASGSTVTVPVLRPSFALGLSDLMDNPNKVNRDGSTDDGSPTFSDGSTIRFGDGGTITFDGTGGDISNVNTLSARDGSFSNNLTVGNKLTADTAEIENANIGTLTAGNTTINGTLDVTGQITGNLTGNVTGNTNGTHTGAVIGDVTGNSSTATRLATARTIALKDGATGTATAFSGAANISIPVTALNAEYLNSGTVAVGRLAGDYNIGITGKATTAGAADTARYASTTGLLKDTDGDTPGQFTMRTTSGGVVEFGGTTPRTSVTFGGSGAVQPTDYWLGTAGTGILHGQSTSATKLHNIRTIALGTGATGTATNFDGTANIVIPVTDLNAGYLTAGTVDAARLSGLYNIAISGKANTAGQADNATNVNGGTVSATTGAFSGALTAGGAVRINESDLTIYGNHTDRSIVFDGVGSAVAKWRLMHSASGTGDANYFRLQTTGAAGSSYSDVVRFGMDTKDAVFSGNILPAANNSTNLGSATYKFANVYATNLNGTLTGNASSATKLATARTIALGTGATGTATAFDGTGNIVIPVTALDAARLSAGVIPTARLSGTYSIGVSGNAGTATKLAAARTINGVAFDGSSNITVADATKLATAGGTMTGSITLPQMGGNWIRGLDSGAPLQQIVSNRWYYPIVKQRGPNNTYNLGAVIWPDDRHNFGFYRFNNARVDNGHDGYFVMNDDSNMVGTGSITAPTFIGALSGNASSATRLAAARTIALATGATGTATAFDGSVNITIPITALNAGYLSAGTIPAARLSGTYNIGISGKANTAGQADNATNVNGGTVSATTGAFSGALTAGGAVRINESDLTIYGNHTDRSIVFDGVGSAVAKWRLMHSASGTGDANYFRLQTTGAAGSSYSDVVRFGMDTKDAVFSGNILPAANNSTNLGSATYKFANVYATNLNGTLTGNASSATKLATARTISLGTGATGTATAFDGSVNITIPITALNAGYLNAGTILTARLSGTYNIGISGKAATAGAADTSTSAGKLVPTYAAQSSYKDPAVNVNIVGSPNDRDTWIYRDPAGGSSNWGIYHRNIDSAVEGLPANSIGFVGGGNSSLQAYVNLSNGSSMFGSILTNPNLYGSYNEGIRLAKAANNYATIMLGVPRDSLSGITANAGQWFISSNPNNNLIISDESSNESTGLVIRGDGNLPTWKGTSLASVNSNVASATQLAVARTIALGTAATGTATAFNGTANITIPVTALNAGYLSAGTIPTARLTGLYNIDISGTAKLARGLTDGLSSVAYATSAGTAGQLVPTYGAQSSYTETAVNVNIVGTTNACDTWIYRDAATGPTGANWGIYHRNIPSDVAGLPANSIGFIGNSMLRAYINLSNGNAGFQSINTHGIHMDSGQILAANASGDRTMGGAIQIRETGYVGAGTDNWETAPKITFHWGGRAAASLALGGNQQLYKINNGGGSQELMITSANIGGYVPGSGDYRLVQMDLHANAAGYFPSWGGTWFTQLMVINLTAGGHSDGIIGGIVSSGQYLYTNASGNIRRLSGWAVRIK